MQFFENPTGVLVAEAQEGFRRIGVPEAEMALRSAIEIVAKAPPAVQREDPHYDECEAREALDALQAKLEPLETRFFRLVDEEIYSPRPLTSAGIAMSLFGDARLLPNMRCSF